MDDSACPTCGKALDELEFEAHHVDGLGRKTADHRFRRLPIIAAALVVVAAIATLVTLVGEDAVEPIAREEPALIPSPRPTTLADSLESDAALGARTRATTALDLQAIIGPLRVGYQGGEGVTVVARDAASGYDVIGIEPPPASDPTILLALVDYELLSDGTITYAIERSNIETVWELSTLGLVVLAPDQSFAIEANARTSGDRVVVASIGGLSIDYLDIPVGSATLAVPHVGVLVMPPPGQTFVARPGSLELFSENRVVAANATQHVEVRCTGELQCSPVFVDRAIDAVINLSDEFSGSAGYVSLSPDGRWVMLVRAGEDRVFDTKTRATRPVEIGEPSQVSWSPNGDFVGWFDPGTDEPTLMILNPFDGSIATVALADLGAPDRLADNVVFFDEVG